MSNNDDVAAKKDAGHAVHDVCANCGIAKSEEIKLKSCDGGCDLVKYCSDGCRELHRPEHAGKCRKRLAELRDRELFRPTEMSHLGECPICCLPLPHNGNEGMFIFWTCCSQKICNGCNYTNKKREIEQGLTVHRCLFCREPSVSRPKSLKKMMKRVKANDPAAICEMGTIRYSEGDGDTGIEYWRKAAELGDLTARFQLGSAYVEGKYIKKDMKKAKYHFEIAAIGGNPKARHNLGCFEEDKGNFDRAVKHLMIAINLGYEDSMTLLRTFYKKGRVTKEKLLAAILAYQAAVDSMKSAERDAADAANASEIARAKELAIDLDA